MKLPSVYTDVLSAGFRKYRHPSQLTPRLGCEQRELRAADTADCSCSIWFKVA